MYIGSCVFLLDGKNFALVRYVDPLRDGVEHGSLMGEFLVGWLGQ